MTGAGESAEYDIEIQVRVPNPRVTSVIDGIIEPGDSWTTDYTPVGMKGTNKGTLEVSKIPGINLEERLQYLIQYPHGCV